MNPSDLAFLDVTFFFSWYHHVQVENFNGNTIFQKTVQRFGGNILRRFLSTRTLIFSTLQKFSRTNQHKKISIHEPSIHSRHLPTKSTRMKSILISSPSIVYMDNSQDAILNLNEALSRKLESHTNRSDHSSSTSGSSVSFSSSIEIFQPTLGRTDYDDFERAATWYSRLEIKSFRKERREIIQQSEKGDAVECWRGLESNSKDGCKQRQMAILNAITAVMSEQEEQSIRCMADPESVAQVYIRFTRDSQKVAYERAARDQLEQAE